MKTPPVYVQKAQSIATEAIARPLGVKINFASKHEAVQGRIRFYQARQALLRQNPNDLSPLSIVETQIQPNGTEYSLIIRKPGASFFNATVLDVETDTPLAAHVQQEDSFDLLEVEVMVQEELSPKYSARYEAENEEDRIAAREAFDLAVAEETRNRLKAR